MVRNDLSEDLVHWTKGTYDEAYEALLSICFDGYIRGGNRGVFTKENCVCFTETPTETFHSKTIGNLKPFGVRVSKRWAFSEGALPVIYQPASHIENLADGIKWRHVDFSIDDSEQRRNYTWQREWRIKVNYLYLPKDLTLIVPNKLWAEKLMSDINEENILRGCEDNMDLGYFYTHRPVLSSGFTILWLDIN